MSLLGLPPLRPHFDAAVRDVAAQDPALRVQAAERLGEADEAERERAIVALQQMLADPHPRVRAAAAEACGQLNSHALRAPLIARIDDPDASVREVAIIALTQFGDTDAIDAVRRAVDSEHPETRFQAVLSYVELRPDDAEPLRERIRDEDPMVRMNTALALGLSHDPRAHELLQQCLGDHNPAVRQRAAIALAQRGDDAGRRDLLDALDDPELTVSALDALATLGDRSVADAVARQTTGLLLPLPVRTAAAATLARLGDPRGVELLRKLLHGWRAQARNLAVESIGSAGLAQLRSELDALVHRPRGTEATTLARALAALLPLDPGAEHSLRSLQAQGGDAAQIAATALGAARKPPS